METHRGGVHAGGQGGGSPHTPAFPGFLADDIPNGRIISTQADSTTTNGIMKSTIFPFDTYILSNGLEESTCLMV